MAICEIRRKLRKIISLWIKLSIWNSYDYVFGVVLQLTS